jgi:Ricin-type beta-trefoil lectin domain/Glycosyl hydrolases family 18
MWTGYTWFVSNLYQGPDNQSSIEQSFNEFKSSGIPASKIGIGLPFYGRRYSGAFAPKQTGATRVGAWTNYYDLVNQGLLTKLADHYDTTYGGSYLSGASDFYPYTSPKFIQDVVAWGKSQGIGGFMAFTLHYEFIASASGDAKTPLSTALKQAVGGTSNPTPTPTPDPNPTPTPNPNPTNPSIPTGWVQLVSKNSGKCLNVQGDSNAGGALLWQWACFSAPVGASEAFQLIPAAGGNYQIMNKNGLSLNIWDGYPNNTTDGLTLRQWQFNGTANEVFQVQPTSDGYYMIHPANSLNSCLDVAGMSKNNGASVLQWSCWGGDNQKWSLVPVS